MTFGINYSNIGLIDELYEQYEKDPSSVDPKWRQFFDQSNGSKPTALSFSAAPGDLRVYHLIDAYRKFGHLEAKVNPIAVEEVPAAAELQIENLGFKQSELDQPFPTCGLLEEEEAPLKKIVETLREIYCSGIGVEYMDLQRPELEKWLQERIEPTRFHVDLTIDQKRMILQHLNRSELLEVFIHTKYVGQKRFSLEGGETLIPILAAVLERGALSGVEEIVLGMAHRGRLNVLSNILNKSYADIFTEFEERYIPESFEGSGDVKYHKGFYSAVETIHGHQMKVTLTPNPSHLEAVNPVVEGQTRAKQVLCGNDVSKVLPILVHGDAALSGQGVVYETLQMYALDGYSTGGTIHIAINNHIGFTTLPKDGRSTRYCTDIARAFGAPVFHVNAEDPEGCIFATYLALELRQRFGCDVFIDLQCYRKYGHNESDEPAFTQPQQYQLIRQKKPIREIYRDDLIQQGVLEKAMAESLEEEFKEALGEALKEAKEPLEEKKKSEKGKKSPLLREPPFAPVDTTVSEKVIQEVADAACHIPEGFNLHRKLHKLIEDRLAMVREDDAKPMDWGMAETLAYGTLLWKGTDVRLAGQDSGRGTFSHRHGAWMDQKEQKNFIPLQHMKQDQGRFDLINSLLSEYAALGFEYGYSIAHEKALVLWEAQFGDFCNGSQVMIDQFIATSEQKWGQGASVTMLLPHGYEGQGPEHSSGRIERFLTLCGDNNMQVVNPTTPAQLFHLLRRQVLQPVKKPLIVFTPKGLLRHPKCVSTVKDLTDGVFNEILDDENKKAKRVIFCSGRIYYDLIAERENHSDDQLAIVRIEQLYPLHRERLQEVIDSFSQAKEFYWVQEEPSNMGAWSFISPQLLALLPKGSDLVYVGRERSASPAVGSLALHKKQHQEIIDQLFGRKKPSIFEIASQVQ